MPVRKVTDPGTRPALRRMDRLTLDDRAAMLAGVAPAETEFP